MLESSPLGATTALHPLYNKTVFVSELELCTSVSYISVESNKIKRRQAVVTVTILFCFAILKLYVPFIIFKLECLILYRILLVFLINF